MKVSDKGSLALQLKENNMKLAIVVGHNSASQGAVRHDTGESEFVWNIWQTRKEIE